MIIEEVENVFLVLKYRNENIFSLMLREIYFSGNKNALAEGNTVHKMLIQCKKSQETL